MRTTLAASFAVVMMAFNSGAALAGGDLAVAPMADAGRCGTGPFAGLYIGAHAGYVGVDAKQHSANGVSLKSSDDGWLVGGHVGYNRQCGSYLLGIETDLSWVDASATSVVAGQTLTSSYDYLGTLRVRGGLVRDNVLFYVTGGLAYASIDHELAAPVLNFKQSDSDLKLGWTIGGGIELARDCWTLRAEVLYVDFGDDTHTYTATGPCSGSCTSTVHWKDDMVVGRVGLSLKLHRDEPPVQPLK